jgi:glucoamylase
MPERFLPHAPGWPGIRPRWTSSAKSGVGTAIGAGSRVWFTMSHGILNEIYYPRVDSACTRDFGMIVTDGADYFSEEKRDATSVVSLLAPGVPAFHLVNTAADGRYRIEKDVLSDPDADVVLQRVRFHAGDSSSPLRLFVLLAPHLNNRGSDNTAWVGDYKGVPMLFASRDGHALALACSAPWLARSVGFVGVSDGWQQLRAAGHIVEAYERAENGNVAATAEIDLTSSAGEFVLALGFGVTAAAAAQHAVLSLTTGFDVARAGFVDGWEQWHRARQPRMSSSSTAARRFFDFSAAVLRVHESKTVEGGVIASLSIPWGFEKSDNDLGGYHLVWPRDLVETAGGFLAAGAYHDAAAVLRFLEVTQDADGHWCQNMWLDGTPYWNGIQMDEAALPILLVDLATRSGAIAGSERHGLWPMIRRAAGYLVRGGPVSPQDRWEEDAGYSPFTLGAEIAALLVAAEDADANGHAVMAGYLRDTADAWNASIEEWMYVTGTALACECGVEGYFVRVAEPDEADAASPKDGFVPIKNRPPDHSNARASLMVSPDALALVRFGLRAADDPRIVNTVAVIDEKLRVETPGGPSWHRYNGDGYGEHGDGRPFDGTGIGRGWPLLTGERAHYELAAGRPDRAEALAAAMRAFAGECLLLPEQIWDAPDIPERELVFGGATGSARPLVWAHAEYIKLRRSIDDGRVFDQPPQTVQRYLVEGKRDSPYAGWRFNNKLRTMDAGKILRVITLAPARVHWGVDTWCAVQDVVAKDTGLGVYFADLDTQALPAGSSVEFTFFWPDVDRWEGTDFSVGVAAVPDVVAAGVPVDGANRQTPGVLPSSRIPPA